MRFTLMTKDQVRQMLENLPASCVFDAVEKIKPEISPDFARAVLYNLEEAEVIKWVREAPQKISLTQKGKDILKDLRS